MKNHWNSTLARKEYMVRNTNPYLRDPYDLDTLLAAPQPDDEGDADDSPEAGAAPPPGKRSARLSGEGMGAAPCGGAVHAAAAAPKRRRTDENEGPDLPPGVPRVPVRDAVRMLEGLPEQVQTVLLEAAKLAAPAFKRAKAEGEGEGPAGGVPRPAEAPPAEPARAPAPQGPAPGEFAMPAPRRRGAAAAGGTPAGPHAAAGAQLVPSGAGHTPLPLRHLPTELDMFNLHEGGAVAQMDKMAQDFAQQQ